MEPADPAASDHAGLAGWVSQAEACRRLDVSRSTMYRWRTELGLPSAMVGRRLFYSVEGIDRLLREAAEAGHRATDQAQPR